MAVVAPAVDRNVELSRSILQRLFRDYGPRDFTVRFWDADEWAPDVGQESKFTWALKHPGALRSAYVPPTGANFGAAFLYDDFDVEGDMIEFIRLGNYLHHFAQDKLSIFDRIILGWQIMKLPNSAKSRQGHLAAKVEGKMHSIDRDRQAISYHYDFSNKCFELMLGPLMTYSSGVFESDDEPLYPAQERKLDLLCKKLRLKPGERLLDIGSGWGGLIIHAAKNYGVEAVGITISKEQCALTRERIAKAGLSSDRCRVELMDYRDLDPKQPFDKMVTVEVLEHFGGYTFPIFFRKMFECLKPRGTFMIQQITLSGAEDTTAAPDFSRNYVFPDGELTPVSTTLRAAEGAGFEVRDVEGIREHYITTLRHWLANTEEHHDDIVSTTSEAGYRMFRIYFAAACYGFLTNVYNLHQILLSKPDADNISGLPRNRHDWYAN